MLSSRTLVFSLHAGTAQIAQIGITRRRRFKSTRAAHKAAQRAFSLTRRITQRDGRRGQGRAEQLHPHAPRLPMPQRLTSPRRSAGSAASRRQGQLDYVHSRPWTAPGYQATAIPEAVLRASAVSRHPGPGSRLHPAPRPATSFPVKGDGSRAACTRTRMPAPWQSRRPCSRH